ncbi:MAG TPA: type II secretion system protein [Candidatus Saccharimonadales bacterium]
MKQRGFTVIELLVVIVALIVIGIVGWQQFNEVQSVARDDKRRIAINTMYYNLEDIFYKTNKYYPETIDEKNLTSMDASLLTDPSGNKVGTGESDYRYEPVNCTDGHCKGYTLRADLEREADFVKTNKENK